MQKLQSICGRGENQSRASSARGAATPPTSVAIHTHTEPPTTNRSVSFRNTSSNHSPRQSSSDDGLSIVSNGVPSVRMQAVVLLAPVGLYGLMVLCSIPFGSLLFLMAAFLAVRQTVIFHLGGVVLKRDNKQLVGQVTCRFKVDLKGVLRYLSNTKEERRELKNGNGCADTSIIHIVACAVARALRKERRLNLRRVCIPWLFIDEHVMRGSESVSVSVMMEGDDKPITVDNVDRTSVQQVADNMRTARGQRKDLGHCLVIATPNYVEIDMETDAFPTHPSVGVIAVIGGVSLDRHSRRSNSNSQAPRPVLALSLTIGGPRQSSFTSSRRFAEEVQKLLQYPEMCDQDFDN
jgi:hypothetical protein